VKRGAFVQPADQVEEQLAARLREGQVPQLVEDDEVDPTELVGEPAGPTGLARGLEAVVRNAVSSRRSTFRTVLRDTPRVRAMALMLWPSLKCSRRILAIVSTISTP